MTTLSLLALFLTQNAEWPGFRGPTGDGVAAPDADPPVQWSETKNVAWKAALPGRGRSSPVILGERIFVTFARERGVQRTRIGPDDMQTAEHAALGAACVDRATGKILWEVTLREVDRPDPVHWHNSWATPTPVVAPGRLFCDFGGYGTWCLDPETGKTVWEKRIPLDHQVGPGSSLARVDDRVILIRDGRDLQRVLALDAKTGDTAWTADRPPIKAGSGNAKKSFSSPLIIESGGRRQVVAVAAHWATAYDPVTGKELWRARHGDGFSIGTVPVFGHGMVFAGTGCFRPNLVALRPDGEGDVTATHVAWRSTKGIPVMSSPLLAGADLYWASDEGVITCADAKTGEARWQARLGQGHLASPLFAGGRIYFFGREGKAIVVKPGAAYECLSENTLEGTVIATPAAVGKALYVRTDTHLYRLESR